MSKIVLAGGTDVGEMALFSLDALGDKVNDSVLTSMESKGSMVRFPTGADGGYLLHIYLEEAIPNEIMKYCVTEDKKEGYFHTRTGKVAFGGVESAIDKFKPNPNIRSDKEIPKGSYHVTAYHTAYPDDYIEEKIQSSIGESGWKYLNSSGTIVGTGSALSIISFLSWLYYRSAPFIAVLVFIVVLTFILFKRRTNSEMYKTLQSQKEEIELDYPSIVITVNRKEE